MTLKLAQFCDDIKLSTKSSYPQNIIIFLKTQKSIEIQNLEPNKMDRAYVCVKISEYPPPPPPPWELAPPWGKFGHLPPGQVRQRNCPGLFIIQSNYCRWNCKWPRKCNGFNLTHGLSELVPRNTNDPKMSLKMS